MEQEKTIRLLLRQLTDIDAQADAIVRGTPEHEQIWQFARYSEEMKEYIALRVSDREVRDFAAAIPGVRCEKPAGDTSLWKHLLMRRDPDPSGGALDDIRTIRELYAKLGRMLRTLEIAP